MIDTHCHLNFDTYRGREEAVLTAAAEAGVHTVVAIGIDRKTCTEVVELADRFDSVYATVGVHPHEAATLDDSLMADLERWSEYAKVVAIGEIGLDYYRDRSPRDVQRMAFERQLELAVRLGLPIVIHMRESFDDTLAVVRDYAPHLAGGVFHCFPGTPDDAARVIEMGFVISVGGVVTYRNAQMAETAREIPLEYIMLETDAPFLTPVPHRGTSNEPAYVALVCQKVAELRGSSPAEVERVTDATAQRLFRLPSYPR